MVPYRGVVREGLDAPAEPVLIEKEEMEKEMEKHDNQRKLDEEDDFEVINHEGDKREAKRGDDMKVQVKEKKKKKLGLVTSAI